MTLAPRRSLSQDCNPSWIVFSDLSAVGKHYFCNTCYIPVSRWKFSSSFGLMLCYIFRSLFSSVTKPVWSPVLQLYGATAPISIVFLVLSISVLSDVVSSLLLTYKLHCWFFMFFLHSELSYSFYKHVIWLGEKTLTTCHSWNLWLSCLVLIIRPTLSAFRKSMNYCVNILY